MGCLTRDQILSVTDDLPRQKVDTPEWGAGSFVYVRTMSGTERDKFESDSLVQRGKRKEFSQANLRARLAAATVCDETGNPLFTPVDAESLGKRSAAVLDRIADVAMALNGLTQQTVEELVGN